MISGLHGPNSAFEAADYLVVGASGAQSIKLLHTESTQHSFDEVRTLQGLGITDFVTRLADSKKLDGIIRGDDEWAAELAGVINEAYAQGLRVFSICNEPNWMHTKRGFGPQEYVWYIKRVVLRLRALIPRDVRLISPPLSFSPRLWHHDSGNPTDFVLDEWLAAFAWKDPRASNAEDRLALWDAFDAAGATVYWQYARQMQDPSFGACYRTIHDRSGGKPIVVLEWASSANELEDSNGKPLYTPGEVEALRVAQYPDWLEQAAASGIVAAAYAFLVGGTTQWLGFRISARLARALSEAGIDLPGLRDQSEWLGLLKGEV